jgi:hypothetical protein
MVGQLLASAKSRAKRDSVPFAISHADIVIPAICPVLGIPLSHGKGVGSVHDGSPSLDKIIPELGYVPGNIHVISHRANRIKADATRSELQAVLAYVEKYSK